MAFDDHIPSSYNPPTMEEERGRRPQRSANARAKPIGVGKVHGCEPRVINSAPHRISSFSCPPSFTRPYYPTYSLTPSLLHDLRIACSKLMLSAAPIDLTFDDDQWTPPAPARLYRAASVGNSWGVTSIGRGFDWNKQNDDVQPANLQIDSVAIADSDDPYLSRFKSSGLMYPTNVMRPITTNIPPSPQALVMTKSGIFTAEPLCYSPSQSRPVSPPPHTPSSVPSSAPSPRMHPSRSPSVRSRRRSSQQRVSLIAGRVSIARIEPPSPPPMLAPSLHRTGSTSSFLSVAASAGPPTPAPERESYLGERSISEFSIEKEIGRGAYGLVKRAREIKPDGSLGPTIIIKQIIKSRILADCWKKHPQHGTIPIEIYVMNAISSTTYVLPPRRPWDASRLESRKTVDGPLDANKATEDDEWVEGKIVHGHPGICPLLDFFEDDHYYYLVLPCSTPEQVPNEPAPPSDLFDLVEVYPQGLPAASARSYLGQIADALSFLHARGIVHRDVKDENVVLGAAGKCILIDFGSSGLVKKKGWDTFSGTLDYAAPEILRGERYYGKEQDVWAFGVVAYVLLVGECPFMTASEAQDGLDSPFANASIALDERCGEGKELEGQEEDLGGALGDAATLVRACLQVDVAARPTFEKILQCRFLWGKGGWTTLTEVEN